MNTAPGYRFLNIKTLQFAFFDSNLDVKNDEMQIANSYSYGVDPETSLFTCILSIEMKQEEKIIVKIETQATFYLNEASMKTFLKDKTFEMPVNIVLDLTSMLYGATRGILVCKLEGTRMSSFVLPPVSLNQVIKTPLTINLE